MPAITVQQLNEAALDVDHIQEVATSTAPTTTDRFGSVKTTMTGAADRMEVKVASVEVSRVVANASMDYKVADVEVHRLAVNQLMADKANSVIGFTDRGAWVTGTAYAVKDVFSNSGTWYVTVIAHTSSASFASDAAKVRVFQGVTVGDLAAQTASAAMGHIADGVGMVARTVKGKLSDLTDVKDFGAVLDGVTDDTVAFQLAAATGKNLLISGGNAKITGAIVCSAGQTIRGHGAGKTIITAVGNFDLFTWNGAQQGGGLRGVLINAIGMTGGICIANDNSDRSTFEDVIILNPFNGIYIKKTNVASLSRVWVNAIRGDFGIKLFGDASNRSDVIDIDNVQVSTAGTPTALSATGLIIDGNVNTVDIRHFGATKCLRAVHILNSSGGAYPAFVTGYDIQSDFPYAECIRVEGGARTILLTDLYAHGSSSADGIYIDSTVQNVKINGGQIDGNYKRGVYAGGRYIRIDASLIAGNSVAGSALWDGVEIGSSSIGVGVTGGLCGQWVGYASNLQGYGVRIAAGAQAYSVVGVNLRNNVTREYLDSANDSTSVIAGNNTGSSVSSLMPGPMQSMSGDFRLNAFSANSVLLGNVGNGVAFAAQSPSPLSVNYLKAYSNAAGASPTLQAVGTDANIDLKLATTGNGVVQLNSASMFASNGAVATSLTGVGPTGSRATVQKWAVIKDNAGNPFYLPLF